MSEHHDHDWIADVIHDEDNDLEVVGDHYCDTCDVVGLTCDECDGAGCWKCNDEGVRVVPGVTAEWGVE